MALTNGTIKSISDLDAAFGWEAPGTEADFRDIVQELQGFRVNIAKGAAASVQCKLLSAGNVSSGTSDNITTDDVILAAVEFDYVKESGIFALSLRGDVRASTSAGYVKFTAGTTANSFILVFWWDKDGYIAQ